MNPALTGIDYLMAMPQYGLGSGVAIRPGIERIRALLAGLGHPEAGIPVIHVAGTNGKGSTASWIAAMLTAHGLRVGLHTSPHLLHAGERMRVDGVAASPAWLGQEIDAAIPLIEETGASYFEVTVAMSLLRFARAEVDVAVVEVGLGGRLDATNILEPSVCVITTVGLDHTHILGDSLEEIAREKGGIIKAGIPVVIGRQPAEARSVLVEQARQQNAPVLHVEEAQWQGRTLRTPQNSYSRLFTALEGAHQRDNAASAVLAVEAYLGRSRTDSAMTELSRPEPEGLHPVEPRAVRAGLRHVKRLAGLRARFEILSRAPLIVVDVAHNPPALAPVLSSFASLAALRRPEVILALMRDKDIEGVVELLSQHDFLIHPLQLESPRALPADEFATRLGDAGLLVGTRLEISGVGRFLAELGQERAVLATGSHQVAATAIEPLAGA